MTWNSTDHTTSLEESATDALRVLIHTPSVEALDVYLASLSLLGRVGVPSGKNYREFSQALAARLDLPDVQLRLEAVLAAWLDDVGAPVTEGAVEILHDADVTDAVLGVGYEADAERLWRERLLAVLNHRDLIDVVVVLAHDTELADRATGLQVGLDRVLRARLLRSLFMNDSRSAVTAGLPADERVQRWWWTDLADLDMDALAQYVTGELRISAEQQTLFDTYLHQDVALGKFLIEWNTIEDRVKKLKSKILVASEVDEESRREVVGSEDAERFELQIGDRKYAMRPLPGAKDTFLVEELSFATFLNRRHEHVAGRKATNAHLVLGRWSSELPLEALEDTRSQAPETDKGSVLRLAAASRDLKKGAARRLVMPSFVYRGSAGTISLFGTDDGQMLLTIDPENSDAS